MIAGGKIDFSSVYMCSCIIFASQKSGFVFFMGMDAQDQLLFA
jgi:hypothetical protein